MDNTRFSELLHLYLNDKATIRDRDELFRFIREGHHDEMIRDRIQDMLSNEPVLEEIDSQRTRKMLEEIVAHREDRIIPIKQSSKSWRWVAAAAVFIISFSAGWWIFRIEPEVSDHVAVQEREEARPVVFSGKQFVHLPDGSTALLNEGSKLTYTPSFGEHTREVTLSGEGYFDVRHNTSKPFTVKTGKITTTVLGTAFNIEAYPGQEQIKVTVTRGSVQVKDDQRTFGIITRDQQIAVNTVTLDFVQRNLKAETAVAWQNEYLILDNVTLKQAVEIIGERYNVKITLANEQLEACRISATFLNGEDLDQVLTVVCGVVHASYTLLRKGSAIIEGDGCR